MFVDMSDLKKSTGRELSMGHATTIEWTENSPHGQI